MPSIVYGNKDSGQPDNSSLRSYSYDYKYPRKLNLKPWSKQHKKLVDMIMRRARESAEVISERFESWNAIDQTMTTYIDLTESEERVQDDDHRKPVSIVFPYTYAILETVLGYLLSAYMQDPIFRYEGKSGEDTIGAMLLELVVASHCKHSKSILNFHTQFRDSLCYGFGIVGTRWDVEKGYKIVKNEEVDFYGNTTVSKSKEVGTVFEGTTLFNIDPYLSLPDPNCPIGNAQQGEMFGWMEKTNLMALLDEEKNGKELFNVRYLKHVQNKFTTIYNTDDSNRNKKAGHSQPSRNSTVFNSLDVISFNIKLIPNDWGLGNSQYPELWKFRVACDSVLIEAKPIKLIHNKIPIGIMAPDFDGYSTTPISRMETLYGLQHTLDWMFNAHVANVRKAINDTLIVDPYLINVKDLANGKPGGIIRTRKPAWGRGVQGAVMQLAVNDITQGHMADSGVIRNAMDKVSGISSYMTGDLRDSGPDRLTGKEFQGTQQGGYTRMERIARIIGVQSFEDIGMQFASNVQQFMSEEAYVKTVGRYEEDLVKIFGADRTSNHRMKVDPMDLLINYDVVVRDGSIPGSNFSSSWGRLFEIISASEELQQEFDLPRIFMHIAENSGAKNVHDFVKVKQMPDDQVGEQVQKGNMITAEEFMATQTGGQQA